MTRAVDDDEVVYAARKGDGVAFGCLFDRYYPAVFRYFVARVRHIQTAEDMAAEVFVEVAERLPRFTGNATQFAAWVFTIARHDLYDARRVAARRSVELMSHVPDRESDDDEIPDQVAKRLELDRLFVALGALTAEQRDVIALKYAAGLSNVETAAILGKPVTSVKSLQHRALGALRRALESEGVRWTTNSKRT